jgi:hypothetical protein
VNDHGLVDHPGPSVECSVDDPPAGFERDADLVFAREHFDVHAVRHLFDAVAEALAVKGGEKSAFAAYDPQDRDPLGRARLAIVLLNDERGRRAPDGEGGQQQGQQLQQR